MILDNTTAQSTAEFLLQINAIKLNSENYFTWASGWKSPIYCDNRIILSFPEVRNYVASTMATYIKSHYPTAEVVAGVATLSLFNNQPCRCARLIYPSSTRPKAKSRPGDNT